MGGRREPADGTGPAVSDAFRIYTADELDKKGYPRAWSRLPVDHPLLDEADMVLPGGIKDVVRAFAGYRCIRCGHFYQGGGEWTRCDARCSHGGEIRYRHGYDARWIETEDWPDVSRQFAYDFTHTTVDPANPKRVLPPLEVEAKWRILTVHHLNGVKADCRWWNLVSLCQRCHLTIQGKVRMERRWLNEHSEWFKPYVAGYYASTLLGEELSRSEVEARLDELLNLEERQLSLAAPLLLSGASNSPQADGSSEGGNV